MSFEDVAQQLEAFLADTDLAGFEIVGAMLCTLRAEFRRCGAAFPPAGAR